MLSLYFQYIYFQPVEVSQKGTELWVHFTVYEALVFCQICQQQTDQKVCIMMIYINDMEELGL